MAFVSLIMLTPSVSVNNVLWWCSKKKNHLYIMIEPFRYYYTIWCIDIFVLRDWMGKAEGGMDFRVIQTLSVFIGVYTLWVWMLICLHVCNLKQLWSHVRVCPFVDDTYSHLHTYAIDQINNPITVSLFKDTIEREKNFQTKYHVPKSFILINLLAFHYYVLPTDFIHHFISCSIRFL